MAVAAPNFALKAKYAFYATLIFFLIANPETFQMTQQSFGWLLHIADPGGCPTSTGFFLHTVLFFLVLWAAMLFPRDDTDVPPPAPAK
jgi:hypothetical protein